MQNQNTTSQGSHNQRNTSTPDLTNLFFDNNRVMVNDNNVGRDLIVIVSPAPQQLAYQINYQDLTFEDELGRGGAGVVYKGTWRNRDTQKQVAIKQLHQTRLSQQAIEEFNRETAIMASLHSAHVVKFFGASTSSPYCIVMEYMERGSLFQLLQSDEELTWNQRMKIASDIAQGLSYLHSNWIFHGDLKSLNVLIDRELNAKLSDFGLARVMTESRNTTTSRQTRTMGSLPWMAPELFSRQATRSSKADIYSFGVLMWELASRRIPFADAQDPQLIELWVVRGEREIMPTNTPSEYDALARECWRANPADRPEANQLVNQIRTWVTTPISPPTSTIISGLDAMIEARLNELGLLNVPENYQVAYTADANSYLLSERKNITIPFTIATGDGRIASFSGGTANFTTVDFEVSHNNSASSNDNNNNNQEITDQRLEPLIRIGFFKTVPGYKAVIAENQERREIKVNNSAVPFSIAGSTWSKRAGSVGITARGQLNINRLVLENTPPTDFPTNISSNCRLLPKLKNLGLFKIPPGNHIVTMQTTTTPVLKAVNESIGCTGGGNNPGLHIGIMASGGTETFARIVLK